MSDEAAAAEPPAETTTGSVPVSRLISLQVDAGPELVIG